MRRGTVQVKKSAADDLRLYSEKSLNIAFERDTANSAALLNLDVRVRQEVAPVSCSPQEGEGTTCSIR
jgi:hypothetical protein